MNAAFYCLNPECARYAEGELRRVEKPRSDLQAPVCRTCYCPLVYAAPSEFVNADLRSKETYGDY